MTNSRPITEDDLHAYVDGAVDEERRREIMAYIDCHADVAARVAAYIDQRAALRAALRPAIEEPIPPRLRIEPMLRRRRGSFTPWYRMAAAATVVFALGGASGWALHWGASPHPAGFRALALEAADTYTVFEPDRLHPVEVRADKRDDLLKWVSQRLKRPVDVPQSVDGYTLMGGRVVATSRGPAAMFMYDKGEGQRIVMLVCPMSIHGTAPMVSSAHGLLTGLTWSERGMGYSVVGPKSSPGLQPLAERIRHEIDYRA